MAKITKRYIDGLRPTAADTVYWDDDLTGFGVRVRPSGGKSYVFRYRLGGGRSGQLRKLTLGPIGSYSLSRPAKPPTTPTRLLQQRPPGWGQACPAAGSDRCKAS